MHFVNAESCGQTEVLRRKGVATIGQLRLLFPCTDQNGCSLMCAFVRLCQQGPSSEASLLEMAQLRWTTDGRQPVYQCIPAHSMLRPVLLQQHPKKAGVQFHNPFA